MIRMQLDGLDELGRALDELGAAVEKRIMRTATRRGAAHLRDEIRKAAPRLQDAKTRTKKSYLTRKARYGHLAKRIALKERKAKDGKLGWSVTTGSAFWARFLELGTRKMGPRPFMRPAFDREAQTAIRIIAEATAERVKVEAKNIATRTARIRSK